jgi:DNA transformation protein
MAVRKSEAETLVKYVLDQLNGLENVTCRRMFGAHGLYCGPTFFGILDKGRLYFRTDATSRDEYLKAGMKPFRPNPRQTLKNYFQVPIEVLEDRDRLLAWARCAVQAAGRSKGTSLVSAARPHA